MSFNDPIRQLKYLRQALSQNKKPLGFFLSAGCPLAVEMPESSPPLIPDIDGLTKYVSAELDKPKADGERNIFSILIDELKKTGNQNPNIENILSFVRDLRQVSLGAVSIRGLSESELISLEQDICKKIVEKTNVLLPNQGTPYHQLAQWIHLIDRSNSPIECFTTNYDLLIEQAFEETGVAYFDGFVGSRQPFFDLRAIEDSLIPNHWTRLWKVHGSINWYLNDKKKVYRSTNVNSSDSHLIHPSHLKYDESRKMPYLALIDRLNSFLRQTSAILLTSGYSFNDTHLNDTIESALKANPTAIVIALLYGKYCNKYEKAFKCAKERFNLSAWAFDQSVIGGQQGFWHVKTPEDINNESLQSVLEPISIEVNGVNSNNTPTHNYELKLGDFAKLGAFLQTLIGQEQFKIDDAK